MAEYEFETWDVFTDRRFGGNPLAVFPNARGLSDADMQALGGEFNLSEITFVLPPDDPANTARVRIFTPKMEMPFAGHPNVGTALALASRINPPPASLVFEELAGLVNITLTLKGGRSFASVAAPRPLQKGVEVPAASAAACAGLEPADILTHYHNPLIAGVGAEFTIAEVSRDALQRATPDSSAFREAVRLVGPAGASLHLYAKDGAVLQARMFAPLDGILEDPATGSANAALAALLLSLDGRESGEWTIHQGVEMGRPSLLHATARRTPDGIRASIGGGAVPVMRGVVTV